jgi:hypothetical protein
VADVESSGSDTTILVAAASVSVVEETVLRY